MKLFELWIRKYNASCSHTETIFLLAPDANTAIGRFNGLFGSTHAVKRVQELAGEVPGVVADDPRGDVERIPQERCGCNQAITWEVENV